MFGYGRSGSLPHSDTIRFERAEVELVSIRIRLLSSRALALATLWLGFGASVGWAQNVLTNGSFEFGLWNGVGGVMALGDGSTYLGEWQVIGGAGGGISWMTSNNVCGFLPSDGLHFLNLANASGGADGAGVQLALPMPVVKGQYYQLTFDLGTTAQDHSLYTDANGLRGPGVQLTLGGSSGAPPGGSFFFGDASLPNTLGNSRWTTETTGAFEATGYWLSIAFSSIGYEGTTLIGLDNISLVAVPVPEPSLFTLLTAGIPYVAWSRQRQRKRRL